MIGLSRTSRQKKMPGTRAKSGTFGGTVLSYIYNTVSNEVSKVSCDNITGIKSVKFKSGTEFAEWVPGANSEFIPSIKPQLVELTHHTGKKYLGFPHGFES